MEKDNVTLMKWGVGTLEGEGIRKYNESIAKNIDQEVRFRQLEI